MARFDLLTPVLGSFEVEPQEAGEFAMTARNRTSCLLHVELLESRFLLNNTATSALVPAAPLDLPQAHPSSGIVSPTPGQSSANSPSRYPAGQDDDDKVSLASAGTPSGSDGSAQSPSSDSLRAGTPTPQLPTTVNLFDERNRSTNEYRDDPDHNHSDESPSAISLPPSSVGVGGTLQANGTVPIVPLPQMAATLIAVAMGPQASAAGGSQELAVAKFLPQSGEAGDHFAFDPAAPSVGKLSAWFPGFPPVEISLRPPATVNEIFRDPLAGLPIKEDISVDLSPLNTEAQALFAHLLNLDPDWAPEMGWSEYLWLTAGVVLACGGVHYYCTLRRRRDATFEKPILRLEEEPR